MLHNQLDTLCADISSQYTETDSGVTILIGLHKTLWVNNKGVLMQHECNRSGNLTTMMFY